MSHQNLTAAFGKVVRRRRERLGISQEELAHKAGLHRTYIGMLERGQRTPSLLTVALLAKGLGTTIASLVKGLDRRA